MAKSYTRVLFLSTASQSRVSDRNLWNLDKSQWFQDRQAVFSHFRIGPGLDFAVKAPPYMKIKLVARRTTPAQNRSCRLNLVAPACHRHKAFLSRIYHRQRHEPYCIRLRIPSSVQTTWSASKLFHLQHPDDRSWSRRCCHGGLLWHSLLSFFLVDARSAGTGNTSRWHDHSSFRTSLARTNSRAIGDCVSVRHQHPLLASMRRVRLALVVIFALRRRECRTVFTGRWWYWCIKRRR
jgi:hypothetical protein